MPERGRPRVAAMAFAGGCCWHQRSAFAGAEAGRSSPALCHQTRRPAAAALRMAGGGGGVRATPTPITNSSPTNTTGAGGSHSRVGSPGRVLAVVAGRRDKAELKTTVSVPPPTGSDAPSGGGIRAKAYWDQMGIIPYFAAFAIAALVTKGVKLSVAAMQKKADVSSGKKVYASAGGATTKPSSIISSEEEEAELHVFKCGGCGYEMYPARGREFKFFPDGFTCPICGTAKSDFRDLNDENDPRNWEDDDDEDDEDDEEGQSDESDEGGGAEGPKGGTVPAPQG